MTTTATANGKAKETLHLHRLEIKDFCRIEALTVDANGKHVVMSGSHAQGKTSTLDAIWAACGGKTQAEMPEPIRRGADKAEVRLDLGEYVLERIWRRSKKDGKITTELKLKAADGQRIAGASQLVESWLSQWSLNPSAFLEMRPQDQIDAVLQGLQVALPTEKVKAITGESHPPRPGESAYAYLMRLSADETGVYYHRRREAGRQWDVKKGALADQRQELASLGGPPAPGEGEQSATEILGVIATLQRGQNMRREANAECQETLGEMTNAAKAMSRLMDVAVKHRQDIAYLETKLAAARKELADTEKKMETGAGAIEALKLELASREGFRDSLPDNEPAISAMQAKLAGQESHNKAIRARLSAAEQVQRLASEESVAAHEHDHLEDVLENLRAVRQNLLEGVDVGVKDLTIGDGELKLHGVSFRQASTAESLEVWAALATRQNPRLKLLRCDAFERLDEEMQKSIFTLANRRGWQIIAAEVLKRGDLQVEIIEREQENE